MTAVRNILTRWIAYYAAMQVAVGVQPTGLAQNTLAVHTGPFGLSFSTSYGHEAIIEGMRYVAHDDQGVALETVGASLRRHGTIQFLAKGPAAENTVIVALTRPVPSGIELECCIRYTGPAREWNAWTCGFLFEFARPVTEVRTEPVSRWVRPTGDQPWQVPGDTPYLDTECQLREVLFGNTALVMVSPTYDPDWIYGRDKNRARFWHITPPSEPPGEVNAKIVLLVVRQNELDPERLAAIAAGRPVAMKIATGRVANLFELGESIRLLCRVSNVTCQGQQCQLSLSAYSYYGEQLAAITERFALPASADRKVELRLRPRERGIIFVTAELKWDNGEHIQRTTIGVLPTRKANGVQPTSPFGMAAIIANPEAYPDQFDLHTVVPLLERIGVRWLRGGWFPLSDTVSPKEEQSVTNRVELLRKHGILPHVQLAVTAGDLPQTENLRCRLATSLERFKWVTPYVEVGNELNLSGVTGAEYVDKLLKPVNEVMRKVHPEGKIMSMGLGGVHQDWLNGFVASGGLELIDILSIHPGGFPRAPEFWEGWRGWVFRSQVLDALKAAKEHGDKEIWITEAYAPTSPDRSMVDLRTSADYLVRTYVCAIALGVQVIEWYQFQDGVWFARRPNPQDVEYNFGIVYSDLTPKPAYLAYATMTEELEGATCQGRLDLGADDLYGVRFLRRGEPVDVFWSYRERHETDLPWWPPELYATNSRKPGEPWVERWLAPVTVYLPASNRVRVTDLMGNEHKVSPVGGKVTLKLTGSPIYVRGLGDISVLPHLWPEID